MIKVGVPFPEFNLETYYPVKKTTEDMALSACKGRWLVLFFYPADFTFVCPTELHDLAKRYEEIVKLGGEVLAVSTDTVFTHKAWLEVEKLLQDVTYPMAADHAGVLAKELGIIHEKTGIADRAVYLIDPDGILQSYEIVADNIGRSSGEIVRKLKALVYVREHPGHACPMSWDTDKKDLVPDIAISGKVYDQLHG